MNQDIEDARFDNGVLLKKAIQVIKDLQHECKKLNKTIKKSEDSHKKEIDRLKKEIINQPSSPDSVILIYFSQKEERMFKIIKIMKMI